MDCDKCGGATVIRNGQTHVYAECGLEHVVLTNIDLRCCENCLIIEPLIERPKLLLDIISRAVALQPYPLEGPEIKFLRNHLGLKAWEWASLMRVDASALSRWESKGRPIGAQTDALVRLLYFRLLEEKEGRIVPGNIAEQIASIAERRPEDPRILINVNDPTPFTYQMD